MKRKTKGKLDCKELNTGLRINEHTLDALVTPGHYKIEPCDVTGNEGFPLDVPQGRLSAYLEVTSTNHSSDRLKDNAIGQVLTVTDSDGVTNIYTRNRTNINGINIWSEWSGAVQNSRLIGKIISFNEYTKNGIYRGELVDNTNGNELFILVVFNNGSYVSQYKHSLLEDGTITYKTRTGMIVDSGVTWYNWQEINSKEIKPNYNNDILIAERKNPEEYVAINPIVSLWRANDTDGYIENSTVTVYDEIYHVSRECVVLVSNNKGRFITSFNNAVDLTTKVLRGSICIQKNYTVENLGSLDIELYSNNVIDNAHKAFFRLQYGNLADLDYNSKFVRSGWFHFCINPDSYIAPINKGADFDITNITHLAIHPYHTNNIELKIYANKFSIVDNLLRPGLITIVDNFDPFVPLMADYAFSKGIKLNLSIIPNWIGKSTSATLDEIYRIREQGHFIFNHTFNHITDTSSLSELEIIDEITKAAEWMNDNGFKRGKYVVSNPSAMFPFIKYKAYMNSPAQIIYHHWTTMQTKTDNGILLYYPYYPMSRLLNISSLDKCDDAIIIAQKAIEKGGIAVNGYHGTFWSSDGGVKWKRYIDAIADLGINCYGIDELVDGNFI